MWLETPKLIIREFQIDDCQSLAPILANPQVMKFSPTGPLSTAQTQEKIENFMASYTKYGFGKWAVILKETGSIIGYCGLAVEILDGQEETEIGYRLDEPFWGKGFATEAASAALQHSLTNLKISDIIGIVAPENVASVRVLKKLGMRCDRQTVFHGFNVDIYRHPEGYRWEIAQCYKTKQDHSFSNSAISSLAKSAIIVR